MRLIFSLFIVVAVSASCTRKSGTVQTVAPQPAVAAQNHTASTTGSTAQPDESRVTSIANREIIRRQEMLKRADETALRASQAMAAGDLEGAVSGYQRASQAVR